ncbi:MAG: hypothetical protein KDA89_24935 [Planctomycetaceae bacterium]|nr:hypothetical protein [Planctomycetaceae bacterium]
MSALFGTPATAQQESADAELQKRADLVSEWGTAAELTAFGRGELNELTGLKDFKSPEALVAAGGILLRLHRQTGGKTETSDISVTDDSGSDIAAEGQAVSLQADAEALFDEARGMVAGEKAAALEKQIQAVSAVEQRGAVGGPRVISRTVKSGKTHAMKIEFAPDAPASVAMRGSGTTQFEIVGSGGKTLWHSKGSWGTYTWNTGGRGSRNITVKVINKGGPPVAYTVVTN